jgi:predicted RNase H-like HicB family nuclease
MTKEYAAPEEFKIEFELQEDGRWIAEVVDLPGVLAYGTTQDEARLRVGALARQVILGQA